MKNLKRIWKNYNKWEDFKAGFFGPKQKYTQEDFLKIENTLTSEDFYTFGVLLFSKWENCINHNLSYVGSNRKSYLGQAVCCYLYGFSAKTIAEVFTLMSKEKQIIANNTAKRLIDLYEKDFYKEQE